MSHTVSKLQTYVALWPYSLCLWLTFLIKPEAFWFFTTCATVTQLCGKTVLLVTVICSHIVCYLAKAELANFNFRLCFISNIKNSRLHCVSWHSTLAVTLTWPPIGTCLVSWLQETDANPLNYINTKCTHWIVWVSVIMHLSKS